MKTLIFLSLLTLCTVTMRAQEMPEIESRQLETESMDSIQPLIDRLLSRCDRNFVFYNSKKSLKRQIPIPLQRSVGGKARQREANCDRKRKIHRGQSQTGNPREENLRNRPHMGQVSRPCRYLAIFRARLEGEHHKQIIQHTMQSQRPLRQGTALQINQRQQQTK